MTAAVVAVTVKDSIDTGCGRRCSRRLVVARGRCQWRLVTVVALMAVAVGDGSDGGGWGRGDGGGCGF